MLPQQPSNMASPVERAPEMMPPVAPRIPEYNDQFIETLAQRLMPRFMPEIQYRLRIADPARARNRALGMSLALAIVSLALMIPLTAIVLGVLTTALGGGIVPGLVGISIVGLVMVLINITFNYLLFNARS